jgi:hypothetical protein
MLANKIGTEISVKRGISFNYFIECLDIYNCIHLIVQSPRVKVPLSEALFLNVTISSFVHFPVIVILEEVSSLQILSLDSVPVSLK